MKIPKFISVTVAALLTMTAMTLAATPVMAAGPTAASPAWAVVPSPNAPGSTDNLLRGVSCILATSCVAVGESNDGSSSQTLIETWNGNTWAIVPSPDTSANQQNVLAGVSCTSAMFCAAVGNAYNGVQDQTLIEMWDGTTWSIIPSPDTSSTMFNGLTGVSCTSSTSCVAVGYFSTGSTLSTLIETWDGTSWSITPSPDTSPTEINLLSGVSCTSPTACVSVGTSNDNVGGRDRTLIETWDGASWSIALSPDTSPSQNNDLNGVSCASATSCVAVGSADATSQVTLIETWDGASWSIASSPDTSPTRNDTLASVSCSSAVSCVAVGASNSDFVDITLIEVWDGSSWSISPNPVGLTTNGNHTLGVSCTSPTACIAVGYGIPDSLTTTVATMVLSAVSSGGYRLAATDGGVFAFGSSPFFGSAGAIHLNQPVVGTASTPNDQGYWLVATDGGVFAYGNAGFYGSAGAITLNKPIVGMAATADGKGYWLVASDGGIFAYGDAAFYGSMGGSPLNKPIVGMSRTNDGKGYWLVATDGGVFAYGDAVFSGSAGGSTLAKPIVGMATSPIGSGYWLVAADGGIFSYGGAAFFGSTGGQVLTHPIVGMAADQTGHGYWLAASGGGVFAFGDAPPLGNQAGFTLANPIVGIAG